METGIQGAGAGTPEAGSMAAAFDSAFGNELGQSAQPSAGPAPAAGEQIQPGVNPGPGTEGQAQGQQPSGQQPAGAADEDRSPIPYERFRQVNTQKNNYEELVQRFAADPNAYRAFVMQQTGRDPFAVQGQGSGQPADPVEAILGPALGPDNFVVESDYENYQKQRAAQEQIAKQVIELRQMGASVQQERIEVAREKAMTTFTNTVDEIEKTMGIKLTPEERDEIRVEASLYGNSLDVRSATVRAARVHLFDTARKQGRAAEIRQTKSELGSAAAVGGKTAAASESKMGIRAAMEKAYNDNGG